MGGRIGYCSLDAITSVLIFDIKDFRVYFENRKDFFKSDNRFKISIVKFTKKYTWTPQKLKFKGSEGKTVFLITDTAVFFCIYLKNGKIF